MNENKKKWSEEEFDKQEYELLRYMTLFNDSLDVSKEFRVKMLSLLDDIEYQRLAISLVTSSELGYTSFRGPATVSFLLNGADTLNKEIKEELLHNLLYEYIDEEHKIPLILGKDLSNYRYIYLVVTDVAISLNVKQQEKIAECLCQIVKEMEEVLPYENDVKLITSFILRKDIKNSFKLQVINKFDEVVANAVYEEVEVFLNNRFDLSVEDLTDGTSELSEVFDLIVDKL